MQINGGMNDMFAAWADAGGLSMGYFDGSRWRCGSSRSDYTLADNFFLGAFGGSFLNHQYLVCACAPDYPNADRRPRTRRSRCSTPTPTASSCPSCALGRLSPAVGADRRRRGFATSGNLTPKDYFGDGTFHAVNTMQPAVPAERQRAGRRRRRPACYADPAERHHAAGADADDDRRPADAQGRAGPGTRGGWNAARGRTAGAQRLRRGRAATSRPTTSRSTTTPRSTRRRTPPSAPRT